MQRRKSNKGGSKGKGAQVKVKVESDLSLAPGPIDQIPKEVMALIFLAATERGKATGTPDYPLPEVTISHVCGNWRAIALSVPSLWTFFHFNGGQAIRAPDDRLEAYLERSQNRHMDFRVEAT